MKKILSILLAVALTGFACMFVVQAWKSTAQMRAAGEEHTLTIGARYNASRWSAPFPFKKLHRHAALLAPDRAMVIETDQDLITGRQYFIRQLTPGPEVDVFESTLRPIPGRLRPFKPGDPAPGKSRGVERLERLVALAIGPTNPPTVLTPPAKTPEISSDDSLPFVFVEADEGTLLTLWRNSRGGEWFAVFSALFLSGALLLHAYTLPWPRRWHSPIPPKEFVHPTLRPIDPDPPQLRPRPIPFHPSRPAPEPSAFPEASPTEPVLKLARPRGAHPPKKP